MRRPLLALPLLIASALVLAGCASDGSTESTPDETPAAQVGVCDAPSGDVVESLDVSGDFGTTPVVDFAAPLAAVDETQVSVAIQGDEVAPGASVEAAYVIINGTTGAVVDTFGYAEGEDPIEFRADAADSGVGEDDMLVFVADVVADLTPAEWVTDVPEVGGTDDAPTVTLPDAAPKTDLEIAVLTQGDGDVVGAADSVTVHYLGTSWETGEVFDQSYARGEPATFSVQGVVPGFRDALIGQKVGTRLLVTMPPALGYGEAGTSDHELAGQTLVFLIDIVAIAG